jgi:hypothetical protein
MKGKTVVLLLAVALAAGALLGARVAAQREPPSVRPAYLQRMQNIGVKADESGRPVFLPPEWGYLVAVERTGTNSFTLFLQSTDGPIYTVRLLQNGDYLYLDTYDKGGVALVLERQP